MKSSFLKKLSFLLSLMVFLSLAGCLKESKSSKKSGGIPVKVKASKF